MHTLVLCICFAGPATAQTADSLLVEAPGARIGVHAADWARQVIALRVRADPS
jgi:hypothetical protein